MKLYSAAEVEEQNKETTKWIINDGYIYDIDKFYSETPNGGKLIKEMSLKDPNSLYNILDSYIIGELAEFRQDRAASNIDSKFRKVWIVYIFVIILASSILIYFGKWLWIAFAAIVFTEIFRRLNNLHEDLMEEIGVFSHSHSD